MFKWVVKIDNGVIQLIDDQGLVHVQVRFPLPDEDIFYVVGDIIAEGLLRIHMSVKELEKLRVIIKEK